MKKFGDKNGLVHSNINIKQHSHLQLLEVPKESQVDGYSYSSIKMTNNLKPGLYTVVFEIFGFIKFSTSDNAILAF